ncbi:MAG: alpha/beta hydrolase [Gammaproteobacteria bacterium]|nr:alpha/beta hydrolase [Gammaproteobacteria bacterium]
MSVVPEPLAEEPRYVPGMSPAEFEAQVHARCTLLHTACGTGRLAWRRFGEPGRQPLILLHGGFGSWRHFILNVIPLSRHYSVYCLDLPGLGDSAEPPGEYSPGPLAEIVWQGIQTLLPDASGVNIAGFSFGGIVGSHVAAIGAERVGRYIGIAPGALGIRSTVKLELRKQRADMSEAELDATHRHNLSVLMLADPERIDALAVYLQRETVRRARVRSGDIPFTDLAARALERCSCAISGIWGSRDAIAAGEVHLREAVFRRIQPDCRFEVIEGAGHWVMYDRPDAFNRVMLELLASPGR